MGIRKQAIKLVMLYYDIIMTCDRHVKTWHMGFCVKTEFEAYLKRSTLELTCVQVSDQSYALIQCFVCDHATPPRIEKLPSKGAVMHTYSVFVYYI